MGVVPHTRECSGLGCRSLSTNGRDRGLLGCPSVCKQDQAGVLLGHRAWGSQALYGGLACQEETPTSLSGDAGAGRCRAGPAGCWCPGSSPSESGWVGAVAAEFLAGSPEESFVITT